MHLWVVWLVSYFLFRSHVVPLIWYDAQGSVCVRFLGIYSAIFQLQTTPCQWLLDAFPIFYLSTIFCPFDTNIDKLRSLPKMIWKHLSESAHTQISSVILLHYNKNLNTIEFWSGFHYFWTSSSAIGEMGAKTVVRDNGTQFTKKKSDARKHTWQDICKKKKRQVLLSQLFFWLCVLAGSQVSLCLVSHAKSNKWPLAITRENLYFIYCLCSALTKPHYMVVEILANVVACWGLFLKAMGL